MKYRVLVGLNYPTPKGEKRAEPGECVEDIPKKSLDWLIRQGCVVACDKACDLCVKGGEE